MAYAWLVRTTLGLTQISYQGNLIGHRYTKIEMTIDRDKQPLQIVSTPPRLGVDFTPRETANIRF